MTFKEQWTLENVYPNGVEGEAFTLSMSSIREEIEDHIAIVTSLPTLTGNETIWQNAVVRHLQCQSRLYTPISFAGAWSAVRAQDPEPATARKRLMMLWDALKEAWVPLSQGLDLLDDDEFAAFINAVGQHKHALKNHRVGRHLRNSRQVDALLAELEPQALHGWGDVYKTLAGRLKATLTLPGKDPQELGISQVTAYLTDPNESVRKSAFEACKQAWASEESLCSLALNQITETRRKRNKRLGVDDLEHTLSTNRLDRDALDAMWTACDTARPALLRYIDRKNQLLGHDILQPWNIRAPLTLSDDPPLTWDQACTDIIASFHRFDPDMAVFARRALEEGWVDAKPGPNRRMGGFCTSLPDIEESRIFMTFSGTLRSAMTLAHELGHAYHNDILFEQPTSMRTITSSTAESASTFAEALFRDYMFEKSESEALKIQMLDQQLSAGLAFLISIPLRFEFERALYLMAEQGPFTSKKLHDTWARLWKQGYGGRMPQPSTFGWCSALHYYISHFGFYNWPYTFGYLFSGYVYQQALATGPKFRDSFRNLLIGTGYRHSVPLVKDALGADLTSPDFWAQSISPLLEIEQQFMALTHPLVAKVTSEA